VQAHVMGPILLKSNQDKSYLKNSNILYQNFNQNWIKIIQNWTIETIVWINLILLKSIWNQFKNGLGYDQDWLNTKNCHWSCLIRIHLELKCFPNWIYIWTKNRLGWMFNTNVPQRIQMDDFKISIKYF